MSLRHGTVPVLISLLLAFTACRPPGPTGDPTAVARGLRFVSHNAAYDAFFADLHDEQLAMLRWPQQERNLRKDLAAELKVSDGATTTLLAERAAVIARGLSVQGTTLKLDVEGFDAVDEADTAAQMRVSGPLDGENLKFAEAVARAARSELKLLAHLNALEQSLQRLAAHAAILEAETDRAFAAGGPKQTEIVHRNLSDARLLIALMDERRLDLAVDTRRTVERVANAVTTNAALGAANEPPLVTFVRPEPPKDRGIKGNRPGGGPATTRGGATKSPQDASQQADFEP